MRGKSGADAEKHLGEIGTTSSFEFWHNSKARRKGKQMSATKVIQTTARYAAILARVSTPGQVRGRHFTRRPDPRGKKQSLAAEGFTVRDETS